MASTHDRARDCARPAGVSLTVTSFTWREHVTELRVKGNELAGLSARDYPGARALINGARVPKLPMRPSVLEARSDVPQTTTDGCISDFGNLALIKCTYGDTFATRTIALAGGSHAEHWITALDLLGRQHEFKVVTYLKMGCPLSTEPRPLIAGSTILTRSVTSGYKVPWTNWLPTARTSFSPPPPALEISHPATKCRPATSEFGNDSARTTSRARHAGYAVAGS